MPSPTLSANSRLRWRATGDRALPLIQDHGDAGADSGDVVLVHERVLDETADENAAGPCVRFRPPVIELPATVAVPILENAALLTALVPIWMPKSIAVSPEIVLSTTVIES